MLSKVRCGFLGMRKLEFMFNLRSLKNATASAKMDLGEFFTSEKITDDQRFFYECYGAWLQDKLPSNNSLKKFSKIYRKLSVDKLHEIKLIHAQSNIISKNYLEALKKTADEKKKPLTWAELHDIVIGDLQIPYEKALQMQLSELIIMQLGNIRKNEDYLTGIRLIMWEIRTKYLKRGRKIKPEDIFIMNSDKKEIHLISKEEMKRLRQITSN